MTVTEVPEVICGAKAAHCVCVRPPHDDATHHCVPECGGSWREVDGRFEPITFPGAERP